MALLRMSEMSWVMAQGGLTEGRDLPPLIETVDLNQGNRRKAGVSLLFRVSDTGDVGQISAKKAGSLRDSNFPLF